MKNKLIVIIAVLAVMAVPLVIETSIRKARAGTPSAELAFRIKLIKEKYKHDCDQSRLGIMAGYLACQRGIPLTNYLAEVEAAWDKLLADQIIEATK